MANNDWSAAHRREFAAAGLATRRWVGLVTQAGDIVKSGTTPVCAQTTWGAPADYNFESETWARSAGSTVSLTIPAGAVANGTVISHYAILTDNTASATVCRKRQLSMSQVVNDGSRPASIDVTPEFIFRGD